MKKIRIDQLVFDRGLTESRERAKTSIMSGLVFVNGQRMDKPGMAVNENAVVELKGEAVPYVSRGGLKLEKALKIFNFDPSGLVCIDCGASTGGFTDVLLQNGAKKGFHGTHQHQTRYTRYARRSAGPCRDGFIIYFYPPCASCSARANKRRGLRYLPYKAAV